MQVSIIGIVLTMLGIGLVGGLANYFRPLMDADGEGDDGGPSLRAALIWGVCAALLVPLFLNTLSSDLLDNLLGESGSWVDFLVFTGFCLLAAITSRTFIDSLSERVLKKASQAQALARKTESRVDAVESEVDPIVEALSDPWSDEVPEQVASGSLSDQERGVLGAVQHEKFVFRTLGGIAKAANLSRDETERILIDLSSRKLVQRVQRPKGEKWTITRTGGFVVANETT